MDALVEKANKVLDDITARVAKCKEENEGNLVGFIKCVGAQIEEIGHEVAEVEKDFKQIENDLVHVLEGFQLCMKQLSEDLKPAMDVIIQNIKNCLS